MGIQDVGGALSRSDFIRSLLPLAAAVGSFRVGAAISVIDQPRLPPLTGTSYEHVGVRYRYTRCGDARVKVFYPVSSRFAVMDAHEARVLASSDTSELAAHFLRTTSVAKESAHRRQAVKKRTVAARCFLRRSVARMAAGRRTMQSRRGAHRRSSSATPGGNLHM